MKNHPALLVPLQKWGMGNDQYFSFNLCTRWREDSIIRVLFGEIRAIRGWIRLICILLVKFMVGHAQSKIEN